MANKSFPRDLLQRFTLRRAKIEKTGDNEEEEGGDIELSLGLSLNGRFGVDPQRGSNIIRSASISNLVSTEESTVCSGGLTRACSLPAETEEERRKRKDLQLMKRMAAKRKRLEKLKNVRVVREKVDNCEENGEKGCGGGLPPSSHGSIGSQGSGSSVVSDFGSQPIGAGEKGSGGGLPPSSHGSIGSQGSGSSGVSDFGSQPIGGTNKYSIARVQSLPEQRTVVTPGTTNGEPGKLAGAVLENPNPSTTVADNKEANETARNMMADMPCVSTRGDGVNGKRIEGFLYKYKKGEEVKIVCVCHGNSLSPAEFVKHAGGGDVAHPLRHIVVSTSSSFLQ